MNETTLHFFYRDNSLDCQITRKALYSIVDNYLEKIIVREIDFDNNKELCDAYHVYGVPTLLVIRNNQVLNRYSGILDSSEINLILEPIINGIQY